VLAPLKATETHEKYDVYVNVRGGGATGQSGAVMLGIARALMKNDQSLEATLRDGNFLTRDSRIKERKKYGQRGARRSFQFSKR
jgi:small subunit ribosomal protein S9